MRGCQQLQPVPPPLFTFELVKWRIPNRNGACSSQWPCGHLRRHVLMAHVGASSCTAARVVEFAECDRGCGNTSGRKMGDADVRQSRARTRGRIWVTEQRFRRCRRGRPGDLPTYGTAETHPFVPCPSSKGCSRHWPSLHHTQPHRDAEIFRSYSGFHRLSQACAFASPTVYGDELYAGCYRPRLIAAMRGSHALGRRLGEA